MSWAQQIKHLYHEHKAARTFSGNQKVEGGDIVELKNLVQEMDDPREVRGLWMAYEKEVSQKNKRAGISMVAQHTSAWDPRLVQQILDRIEKVDTPAWDLMIDMADNPNFNLPSSSALLKAIVEHFREDRWSRSYNRHAYQAIQKLGQRGLVPDEHEIYEQLQENFVDEDGLPLPLTRAAMALDGWSPDWVHKKFLLRFHVWEEVHQTWGWDEVAQLGKSAYEHVGRYWEWLTEHQEPEKLHKLWHKIYNQSPVVAVELLAQTSQEELNFMEQKDWLELTQHEQAKIRQRALRIISRLPEQPEITSASDRKR